MAGAEVEVAVARPASHVEAESPAMVRLPLTSSRAGDGGRLQLMVRRPAPPFATAPATTTVAASMRRAGEPE
jgi:hypothetical protein